MKKIVCAALLGIAGFGSISAAFAAPPHHEMCHKVRYHHHWVTRCHH